MTATKRPTNQGRQGITGGNRHLAQRRVKLLIEHSTSHKLLLCIDRFVLRNPPLRHVVISGSSIGRHMFGVVNAKIWKRVTNGDLINIGIFN
jgi:hypothetical protein